MESLVLKFMFKFSKYQLAFAALFFTSSMIFSNILPSLYSDHSIHNILVKGSLIIVLILIALLMSKLIKFNQ
jgi:hypothetical protein